MTRPLLILFSAPAIYALGYAETAAAHAVTPLGGRAQLRNGVVVTIERDGNPTRLCLHTVSPEGVRSGSSYVPIAEFERDELHSSSPAYGPAYNKLLRSAALSPGRRFLACDYFTPGALHISVYDLRSGRRAALIEETDAVAHWISWCDDGTLRYLKRRCGQHDSPFQIVDYAVTSKSSVLVGPSLAAAAEHPDFPSYRRRAQRAARVFIALEVGPPLARESSGMFNSNLLGINSPRGSGAVSDDARCAAVVGHSASTEGNSLFVIRGEKLQGRIPLNRPEYLNGLQFQGDLLALAFEKQKRVEVWSLDPLKKMSVLEGDFLVYWNDRLSAKPR